MRLAVFYHLVSLFFTKNLPTDCVTVCQASSENTLKTCTPLVMQIRAQGKTVEQSSFHCITFITDLGYTYISAYSYLGICNALFWSLWTILNKIRQCLELIEQWWISFKSFSQFSSVISSPSSLSDSALIKAVEGGIIE